MENDLLIFSNRKSICRSLGEQLRKSGVAAEALVKTGVYSGGDIVQVLRVSRGRRILLVFKNDELKELTALFHRQGCMSLLVYPWDTHFSGGGVPDTERLLISIDNSKPRLDYLEIEVSESCNLNCKGCNEFSNLVGENRFGDLPSTVKDLTRLRDLFWGIGKIRLMGGEPLVNPDYLGFVRAARQLYPDSDIRLLTNGLLIPKLKKEDLAQIRDYNCSFDISVYPPTRKALDSITERLRAEGIRYNLSIPNKLFFKSLLRQPAETPDPSFENCLFTHCHALNGGFLSACSNQMYAHRLNTAFGLAFPTDDKIDIYNTALTGWEINEIFAKPHEFCRFCAGGLVPYKWKGGVTGGAKTEDWLIEPSFLNMKAIPFVQKTVKSAAKRLRQSIQRPKGKR